MRSGWTPPRTPAGRAARPMIDPPRSRWPCSMDAGRGDDAAGNTTVGGPFRLNRVDLAPEGFLSLMGIISLVGAGIYLFFGGRVPGRAGKESPPKEKKEKGQTARAGQFPRRLTAEKDGLRRRVPEFRALDSARGTGWLVSAGVRSVTIHDEAQGDPHPRGAAAETIPQDCGGGRRGFSRPDHRWRVSPQSNPVRLGSNHGADGGAEHLLRATGLCCVQRDGRRASGATWIRSIPTAVPRSRKSFQGQIFLQNVKPDRGAYGKSAMLADLFPIVDCLRKTLFPCTRA